MSHIEPNSPRDLFREEAIQARKDRITGGILLSLPLSTRMISCAAIFIVLSIILFSITGTYTKRITASGQMLPATGVARVYSNQAGTIIEKNVTEGQHVKKGDALYTITGDRRSYEFNNTLEAISRQIREKISITQDETDKLQTIQRAELDATNGKIKLTRDQISTLKSQISEQRQKVTLAEDSAQRYDDLLNGSYISKDQAHQKQSDLLDQRSRLRDLQRSEISAKQELHALQGELRTLPARQRRQIDELNRQEIELKQSLVDNESRRLFIVHAPSSGAATFVIGEIGQSIDPSRPLLNLIAIDQPLYADVFAPSKAIGFLKPGDTVRLRYAAYPYQKFGTHSGKIRFISKNPMTPVEIAAINGGIPGLDIAKNPDLYYRISIIPDSQIIQAYGKTFSLRSGMALEVEIFQEKKRIYEWILDPIIGLRGKLI